MLAPATGLIPGALFLLCFSDSQMGPAREKTSQRLRMDADSTGLRSLFQSSRRRSSGRSPVAAFLFRFRGSSTS